MKEETIEHRHLDHEVELPLAGKSVYEVDTWCQEQFGPRWQAVGNRTGRWSCFWSGKTGPISYRHCFAYEQDMFLFLLRWS
jgi:hypothetical protein